MPTGPAELGLCHRAVAEGQEKKSCTVYLCHLLFPGAAVKTAHSHLPSVPPSCQPGNLLSPFLFLLSSSSFNFEAHPCSPLLWVSPHAPAPEPPTVGMKVRFSSPIASHWGGGEAWRACPPPTHPLGETCLSREGEQHVGKPRALERARGRERWMCDSLYLAALMDKAC